MIRKKQTTPQTKFTKRLKKDCVITAECIMAHKSLIFYPLLQKRTGGYEWFFVYFDYDGHLRKGVFLNLANAN